MKYSANHAKAILDLFDQRAKSFLDLSRAKYRATVINAMPTGAVEFSFTLAEKDIENIKTAINNGYTVDYSATRAVEKLARNIVINKLGLSEIASNPCSCIASDDTETLELSEKLKAARIKIENHLVLGADSEEISKIFEELGIK